MKGHYTIQAGEKKGSHTHKKDPISLTMSPFCARLIQSSAVVYSRKRAPPILFTSRPVRTGVVSSVCRLYPAVSLQRYEVRARSRLSVIDFGEGREREKESGKGERGLKK